jgi:hypothetical protein
LLDEWQAHEAEEKKQGLGRRNKPIKMESHVEPIYCHWQSKEMLKKPKPSLPSAPPNRLVNMSTVLGDAFWLARAQLSCPFKRSTVAKYNNQYEKTWKKQKNSR